MKRKNPVGPSGRFVDIESMQGIAAQVIKHLPSPRILGIVTADMLLSRLYPEDLWNCGGVEVRADGVPYAEILPMLRDFTRSTSTKS